MKLDVRIADSLHTIEITGGADGHLLIRLNNGQQFIDTAHLGDDRYSILLDGASFEAQVLAQIDSVLVLCGGQEFHADVIDRRTWKAGNRSLHEAAGPQRISSPMPGRVVRVLVTAGTSVEAQEGLIVVEAMKMQNEIRAGKAGIVERVLVTEGQTVGAGEPLMVIA
jgi:biotin carboxyl carrier protein